MLSKDTRIKIQAMMQNIEAANEVINRLSVMQNTPFSSSDAENMLNQLNSSDEMNRQIRRILQSKMANYDHGECGIIIADTLVNIVEVLDAAKNDKETVNLLYSEPLDKICFEALALALAGNEVARNFEKVYDTAVASMKAIKRFPVNQETKKWVEEILTPEILADAKQDRVHVEAPPRSVERKRIYFKSK